MLDHNPVRRCAYRNHSYPEGYAHAGRWLGSAAGADSRLLTVGWLTLRANLAARACRQHRRARRRLRIRNRDGASRPDARTGGAPVMALGTSHFLGAELDWFTVHAQQGKVEEARLGMTVRMPFDPRRRGDLTAYDSAGSIGSRRSRTVSHAPAAPQTAISAIPTSEAVSGTCENISQPPSMAKAICA